MRYIRRYIRLTLATVAILAAGPQFLCAGPINTTGQRDVHDPSRISKLDGVYYVFYTGSSNTRRIRTRTSTNLTSWTGGTDAITTAPTWAATHVPNASNYWAPDVVFADGEYHMYYSVSTFGSQQSGIGLMTNPTLNPSAANYAWTDRGAVLTSTNGSPYNAIDPGILQTSSGKMYMSFGSFWNGLYITELDPATGLRITPNSAVTRIAQNPSGAHPIEAAYLHERSGYFYLFVNYDTCCAGVNSTYNIRVGRSTSPTGPFLDKNGVNMVSGGGSPFLSTEGTQIGPGHLSIFEEEGQDLFTYHYYDGTANGAARLNWRTLEWAPNGWPVIGDTLAPTDFNADGDRDGEDLARWSNNFGTWGSDADGDRDTDGNDFLIWQRQLGGAALEVGAETAPEPATATLLAACCLAMVGRVRACGRAIH